MSVAYLSMRLSVTSTRVLMVLMQFAGFLHMGTGLVKWLWRLHSTNVILIWLQFQRLTYES